MFQNPAWSARLADLTASVRATLQLPQVCDACKTHLRHLQTQAQPARKRHSD
jgi:hypothetical protein